MTGLSRNAYKVFLIERLLDTYSGTTLSGLITGIRKIISEEITKEDEVINYQPKEEG